MSAMKVFFLPPHQIQEFLPERQLRITLSEVREKIVLDLDCVAESSETLEGVLEVASVLLFTLSPESQVQRGESFCRSTGNSHIKIRS